jgi:hypothetical protein
MYKTKVLLIEGCCLLGCCALMMEAASTSETSVNFYQTTRCYNQEGSHQELAASIIRAMMEAASTSETSVNFYQTTRRNIPEDSHLL